MPEFVLDIGDAAAQRRFNQLDSFTQGYIEAMFFTSTPQPTFRRSSGRLPELRTTTTGLTFGGLLVRHVVKIAAECAAWQQAHALLLARAYERDDYSEEQAGRDYWYTRNGHGVGFWARDQLTEAGLGEQLTKAAGHSERWLYRGDNGRLYYYP